MNLHINVLLCIKFATINGIDNFRKCNVLVFAETDTSISKCNNYFIIHAYGLQQLCPCRTKAFEPLLKLLDLNSVFDNVVLSSFAVFLLILAVVKGSLAFCTEIMFLCPRICAVK